MRISGLVWEFFTDLRGHGLAGVRCRFCHWVTNDRSPTTMKFHLKRKHDTGPGGLWAICEEKINSQAPANYAPRPRKSDDAFIKALTTQRHQIHNFNPFTSAETKIGNAVVDNIDEEYDRLTQHLHVNGMKAESSKVTKRCLSPETFELIRQRGIARAAGNRELTFELEEQDRRQAIKEDLKETKVAAMVEAAEAAKSIR
ncbi:unnamed protein product [Angiostrongylus costaricensis]|uniref:BED-type domain-containing protein n=1 Tax=Angiostrongylus costaricensis TaxID=334426 RepID=A0A0R3PP43_ANGCS|nr:unnamed protein product [Angiostrongylus costaricensis]